MKKIYIIYFCLIPAFLMAQNKRVGQDMKGIIYDNEKALELRMHTHGLWMVGVNIGKIKRTIGETNIIKNTIIGGEFISLVLVIDLIRLRDAHIVY